MEILKSKVTKSSNSKPSLLQIWEMFTWEARLVASPEDYEFHRFYERGKKISDASQFVSLRRAAILRDTFNREVNLLKNKLNYDEHFSELGLPVPVSLAVISQTDDDFIYPTLSNKIEALQFLKDHIAQGEHLVIKDVTGMQGAGVMVIVDLVAINGSSFFILSNGEKVSATEALDRIFAVGGQWVVQKRLKQHDLLNAFNSSSINTLRLGTFRNGDGSVNIDYAVLRLGRTYNQIDAFNSGGVAVRINTQTGEFFPMGWQKASHSRDGLNKHPDSGILFAGQKLPFWNEIVELSRRFAGNAGDNKMIGWDIAITPEGPVFLEGNHNADIRLAQVGEKGLLSEAYSERLKRESNLVWKPNTVAPFECQYFLVGLKRRIGRLKNRLIARSIIAPSNQKLHPQAQIR